MTKYEADSASRTQTTGHEWDGIEELNTPLPRWWLWTFYATIVWAFAYWIFYPAWPTISGYTGGVLGYTNRGQVAVDLADLQKIRGAKGAALEQVSLADVEKNPALLAFAQAQGCHGVGATGAKGYPNLNDDDWLWGGTLEGIKQTIEYGARSGNPKAHESAMPAFGKNSMLKPDEIVAVANYVRSLSGLSTRPGVELAAGKKIFADNCAACHGADGKGNQELGAPNLTVRIWLYGSDEADIIEDITNGRSGVMPAWAGRLDPATINALAVYVHTLGGGQ
jgi:cytochrome c oxidase cbb3-type subunit III